MNTSYESDWQSPELEKRRHPSAGLALEVYAGAPGVDERDDFIDHAHRTAALVEVFAGEIVSDLTFDAVALHDVADRMMDAKADPVRRTAAANVLGEYFTSPQNSVDSLRFVSCLLADMVDVEEAAEDYRRQLGHNSTDEALSEALTGGKQGKLSRDMWFVDEPIVDIAHIKQICENVNIESIIVKAAEALDNITHPPMREAAILQDILEIETFYAPLCEVLGLDALAMKLRSECTKQRFNRGGKEHVVMLAEVYNKEAQDRGPNWALKQIFSKDMPLEKVFEVKDDTEHPERVTYGVVNLPDVCEAGVEGTLNYRIKTAGSLARKLDRDPDMPMDILGMTAIVDSPAALSSAFRYVIDMCENNPMVDFTPAPSKNESIYIQGCASYVEAVAGDLGQEILSGTQINVIDNDPDSVYQVCKLTFFVKDDIHPGHRLPVEMQFVTIPDRRNARVGQTAHILFKQQQKLGREDIDYGELTTLLEAIHVRRDFIDESGATVNERSLDRGQALLDELDCQLHEATSEMTMSRVSMAMGSLSLSAMA